MNKIFHRPILDTNKVESFYSEKDGVEVSYVCTSQLPDQNRSVAYDIFYRDTPHPEFGNLYFGLVKKYDPISGEYLGIYISNADSIESTKFDMVKGSDEFWYYSAHAHDFWKPSFLDCYLDGGRDYIRIVGNISNERATFVVRNGKFVLDKDDTDNSADGNSISNTL